MHWDGTRWSVVPSPSPTGALSSGLSNVVAIASRDVWAFGDQRTEQDPQLPAQVLVERWNGATWQIVSSPPLPSPAPSHSGGSLSATRIPGTDQLWAVGEWSPLTMGRGDPLIERWTGTAWQIVPSPAVPAGALGGGWSGVVALSTTNAWAVGSYAATHPQDSHPMIAHWDGTSWQNVVTDLNTEGALTSVAAGAANDVRATGWLVTGPGASNGISDVEQVPLIEQWNGTNWQIASVPALPSGFLSQGQGLNIATDGAGNYWAVGSYRNAAGGYQTLTMHCP